MRPLYSICFGVMLSFGISAPAWALNPVTYVSASGSDTNACTFAAPCRTLQRGVNLAAADGVVQVLNSAGYGNATITKSVTISGNGNVAAMGHRITINGAGTVVALRGLVMDGKNTGSNAILINNAASVHIEDCTVERYTNDGIKLVATSAIKLFVSDTVSRDNSASGLRVDDTSAQVAIENSRFEKNGVFGVYLNATKANVARSIASGNGTGMRLDGGTPNLTETTAADNATDGFYLGGASGAVLDSCVARGSASGVVVFADANVLISNCVIVSNSVAIQNAGTLYSRQNNTIGGPITGAAPLAYGAQ